MTLPSPSIKKLLREHFPGDDPIRVGEGEREAVADELLRPFEGDPWIDTKERGWLAKEDEPRFLRTLTLQDPQRSRSYHTTSFRLMLDEERRLTISGGYKLSATVSSGDELVAFVRECKHRLERRRVLKKRRKKVRGFKHAAMVAQLKQLSREQGFEFLTEETSTARVKLWIRLNEAQDAVEIYFRPNRYTEVLPHLPSVIRSLRESYAAGVSFKIVNCNALPWNAEWIGADEPDGSTPDG